MAADLPDECDQWALELDKRANAFAALLKLPLQSLFAVRPVTAELNAKETEKLTAEQRLKFSQIHDPVRKKEWSESRRCQWLLEKFSYRSISHTKAHGKSDAPHVAMAWGVSDPSGMVQGVGVDVELLTRTITEATAERFSDAEERRVGLTGLELWTAKEAIFKSNPKNQGTAVGEYRVLSRDANGVGTGAGPQGQNYRFHTFAMGPWQITLALQVP